MFELDSRLRNECHRIGRFRLCELLLKNDANYPWLILVPRIKGATELIDLTPVDQNQLLAEINITSSVLKTVFLAEKINIASLGNLVPQLHIHCIARFQTDQAWPAPVWGKAQAKPYTPTTLERTSSKIFQAIQGQYAQPLHREGP